MEFDDKIRFSIQVTWRAKWWQRPILWLCGRPTKTVTSYFDCYAAGFQVTGDGALATFTIPSIVVQFGEIELDEAAFARVLGASGGSISGYTHRV